MGKCPCQWPFGLPQNDFIWSHANIAKLQSVYNYLFRIVYQLKIATDLVFF